MPANMISAPVGSILVVSGSSIATVSAGPTPGSTPMAVPSVTPMKPHSRLIGVSATPKPVTSACTVSVMLSARRRSQSGAAEQRLQPPGRQVHVEEAHEEQEHAEAQHQADRQVAQRPRAAEAAGDTGVERHRRDDE